MTRQFAIGAFLLCISVTAHAQGVMNATSADSDPLAVAGFDPENATADSSIVEGAGWKVGEGTVVHPTFGLETGVISNVFYQNTNTQGAGVLRLLGKVGVGSLTGQRLNQMASGIGNESHSNGDQGEFQYAGSVSVAYDQLLSGNDTVSSTGGLGLGAKLRGMVNPMGPFSFAFNDNFTRMVRAANFETSTDANRDLNNFGLQLFYHPAGRNLRGLAYYSNSIDVFENAKLNYPDRISHRVGIHPSWAVLPETGIFGDLSIGLAGGLGTTSASAVKVSSMPVAVSLGIATLLTLKTTLSATAGYSAGLYASGPSYSSPTFTLGGSYRYSPLGRVFLSYTYDYTDSVNANYYRDHVLRALVQEAVKPFVLVAQTELHFREYAGLTAPGIMSTTVRDDTIFGIVGGLHYVFRDTIAATLDYHFSTVQTGFRYTTAGGTIIDPSFTRQELLLGVRIGL